MEIKDKSTAFSFIIDKFIEWSQSINPKVEYQNKFTKLFILKLLFLLSAVKIDEEKDLLETFNNFYAMPYGPVESDIYNMITNDEIPNYKISDRGLLLKSEKTELNLEINEIEYLNDSYARLIDINEKLISLSAFELVEITHKWESWNKAFKYAKFIGLNSAKMENDLIRNDKVHYFGV